jgi:hypothetical protein
MHQVRRKVMIKNTVFMRNYSRISIIPYVPCENSLGRFLCKSGEESIFKSTIGNESLHQDSNDNSARITNFATSKKFVVKSTMFLH